MKKQIISALLVTGMVTSTLCGCGKLSVSCAPSESPTLVAPSYSEGTSEAAAYEYPDYEEPMYKEEANSAGAEAYCMDSEAECYATYDPACEQSSAADSALCPGDYCVSDRMYYGTISGEKYKAVEENAFKNAVTSPLSTFAADVDTASYANLRRMINDGFGIDDLPYGSIRTEELINYFDYGYKGPRRGDMFAVNASIIDCPWNEETKLVNLGIKAKELRNSEDIPSNIVFLIDVSGSMKNYDKLPLLQMGFDMLVDDLDENDRVSIVTYASSSDVVISGVPGNDHTKIKRAINSLNASGSTNGGDGIKTAYRLAEKYFIEGGNNRVIMATDGDLNVGITSEDELEELISDKKEG